MEYSFIFGEIILIIKNSLTTLFILTLFFGVNLNYAFSQSQSTTEILSLRDMEIGMRPDEVMNIFGSKCKGTFATEDVSKRHLYREYLDDFVVYGEKYITCDQIEILDRTSRRFFIFFLNDKVNVVWVGMLQKGFGTSSFDTHPPAIFEALGKKYGTKPNYKLTDIKNWDHLKKISARIEGANGDILAMSGTAKRNSEGEFLDYDNGINLYFYSANAIPYRNNKIKEMQDAEAAENKKKNDSNKSKL